MFKQLTFLLCLPLLTFAENIQIHSLSSSAVIQAVLQNNKELQVAQHTVEIAQEQSKQYGLLQNPELGIRYGNDLFFDNDENSDFEISFSQSFPLTDRLKKEKEISNISIELASMEVEEKRWKLAEETHQLILKIQLIDLHISLRTKSIALATELKTFVDSRVETGEVSNLDAKQIHIELKKLELKLIQLNSEKQSILENLKSLLGWNPNEALEITTKLELKSDPNIDDPFTDEFIQHRPDYKIAELGLENAEARILLAKTGKWEEITIELFFENEQSQAGNNHTENEQKLGLGISLPLPIWNKQKASIAEQLAVRKQAQAKLDSLRFRIWNEAEATRKNATRLQTQLEDHQNEILKLASENLEATHQAYNNGQVSLFQVIRAQQDNIELEGIYIENLAEYKTALLKLAYQLGDAI